MPDLLVVISGTGTGVGKTWVTARLAENLNSRGVEVAARKPVQSYDPAEGLPDASILAAATGEPKDVVCRSHRSYAVAMAPPLAARALGRPGFRLTELLEELSLPASGVVLVEGVGGPRSPLADDADTVALAGALGADLVILVAGSGLGAINDVVLSASAFGRQPLEVYLNRFDATDPVHASNRAWLDSRLDTGVHSSLDAIAPRIVPQRLGVR